MSGRRCSAIKEDGSRCGSYAMHDSQWCINHDPSRVEANRIRSSKGGRRGTRNSPSAELRSMKNRLSKMADQVVKGELDQKRGATAGMLLNYARACLKDSVEVWEAEELAERLEAVEQALNERQPQHSPGARRYGSNPRGASS